MKRDMDLIRSVLQRVEAADRSLSLPDLEFEGKTVNEVGYHVELLVHQGFIDGSIKRAWGGDCVAIHVAGLTWDGADFLEATGNNEVWSRASLITSQNATAPKPPICSQARMVRLITSQNATAPKPNKANRY